MRDSHACMCMVNKWDNKTAKHQAENIQEETIFKEDNRKTLKQTNSKTKLAKSRREYNLFKYEFNND